MNPATDGHVGTRTDMSDIDMHIDLPPRPACGTTRKATEIQCVRQPRMRRGLWRAARDRTLVEAKDGAFQ